MDVSIEVTARERDVGARLRDLFPRGMRVHVTFLPGDTLGSAQAACIAVARAGFEAVPHLTARNFTTEDALAQHLARLSGEAGVKRALAIGGDVAEPRGPFSSSRDVLKTGLLARYGIGHILIAGYPEGHPSVPGDALDAALHEKLVLLPDAEIVTQFCFEAAPVADWIQRQRAAGIAAPVRIGIAGPASMATLLRFAQRCGIGNSMRALRRHGVSLLDAKPDDLLRDLGQRMRIDAIHLYTFGGLRKAAFWLESVRSFAQSPRR